MRVKEYRDHKGMKRERTIRKGFDLSESTVATIQNVRAKFNFSSEKDALEYIVRTYAQAETSTTPGMIANKLEENTEVIEKNNLILRDLLNITRKR